MTYVQNKKGYNLHSYSEEFRVYKCCALQVASKTGSENCDLLFFDFPYDPLEAHRIIFIRQTMKAVDDLFKKKSLSIGPFRISCYCNYTTSNSV
jgi:hypothetical protein